MIGKEMPCGTVSPGFNVNLSLPDGNFAVFSK